jgi:hypothetical protein
MNPTGAASQTVWARAWRFPRGLLARSFMNAVSLRPGR